MTLPVLILVLVTVVLSACAQLALKLGVSGGLVHSAKGGGAVKFVLAATTTPAIWLGLAIYAASVILWLWILSKVDLSVAYPFVGISFVMTMIFGAMILHESVSPVRIAGTLLIAVGCVLVARSAQW